MTVKAAHRFIQIISVFCSFSPPVLCPALRFLSPSSTSPKTPAPSRRDLPVVVFREPRHKPSHHESSSPIGAAGTHSRFAPPSRLHLLKEKLRRAKSRHNIVAPPFVAGPLP